MASAYSRTRGLGATSRRTQPSEWMSAVLRGRGGLTFEQSLGVLATVAAKELPRHLVSVPGGAHFIIVPAFMKGVGARLYSIDNVVASKGGQHWYRYTSHQRTDIPGSPSVRIAVAGSGAAYVLQKGKSWQRALLSLVKEHDRGKVSDHLIADQLASLNHEAHEELTKNGDDTVEPRCIVVWRRRPEVGPRRGGGAHQFYTGVDRDQSSSPIPTIAYGMDAQALARIHMDQLQQRIAIGGFPSAPFDLDYDEIDRRLAAIPTTPDEKLR